MESVAELLTMIWFGKRHNIRSGRLLGPTQTGRVFFLSAGLLACCSPSLKPIVMAALYTGPWIFMRLSLP